MNIEQLAAQTRLKSKSALFALIGLVLSPLAVVAHTPVSPADSVHFYASFDYEQWQREHPRPAGKRLANLNVGEPRTVRMIYTLRDNRPYRQEVVDKMKVIIRQVQAFYAEQMQAHGYGNRTFRFETDAQGDPLVHREVDRTGGANVYLTVSDYDSFFGAGARYTKAEGTADISTSALNFFVVAHELGHAFGLRHDFRDDAYIMSYGYSNRARLSACNAEFLAVHPYFNNSISISDRHDGKIDPTIEMTSPVEYPAGSASVSIQLEVGSSKGLHQVFLFGRTSKLHPAAGFLEVKACRGLAGEKDAVVEFEYDGKLPTSPLYSLSEPGGHPMGASVVDKNGNMVDIEFALVERSPYRDALVVRLRTKYQVFSLSFSPDGTLLAIGSGTQGSLWKWRTDKVSSSWGQNGRMLFSPDGTLLAVGNWAEVSLWDVASRRQVVTFQPPDDCNSLSFSPDGTLLAVGGDSGVLLWDVASRRQAATFQHGDWVSSLSFSPDGALLAIGGEGGVSVWDVASRRQAATFQHDDWVRSVSFSPDGTLLAIGSVNQATVSVWDVASRRQVATFQHDDRVSSLSFSPDGALLAIGGEGGVSVWDVASRRRAAILYGEDGNSVSFSPDGTLLAIGSVDQATVSVWNVSEWTRSSGQVITDGEEETEEEVATGEEEETTDEEATPHVLTKVSGDRQGGQVGERLAKPFVVSVLDQNGSAFAGAVVTFSVTAGGGTLSATTAATDASGRARTTLTLGSDPGTNTVAATVAGLETVTFTATATGQIPHSLTKVSGDGQQGSVGERLAKPFVVSVLDQNGSAFAGAVVTFSVTAGGGTLSATTDTTDANGRATTRLTLGSDEGTSTVSATVEGLAAVTFTATAITPHSLTKVSGDGQQGPVSTQLAKPFVVLVLDEEDKAMAGVVVTFTVTAGGGTMSSTTAITSPHGRAARTLTLGDQPGANTVEVSVAGLDPVAFTATAIGEELSLDLSDLFNQSGKLVALPDRTQLLQNAPNPFNSQTVVSYFLLEPGPVRLEVFSLSGQRVAVLQQGPQEAGYHRLHWDGRDAAGRSVASGTYLYRLVTDEVVLTRKLVLLR